MDPPAISGGGDERNWPLAQPELKVDILIGLIYGDILIES